MPKRKLPAGVVAPLLIGIGVVVVLIIVLIASGALKFSASVTRNPSPKSSRPETPSPIPTPTISLSQIYTHSSPAYSLNYPSDWALDKSNPAMVMVYSKDDNATSSDKAVAGVGVVSTPLGPLKGSKLSSLVDISKNSIKQQFTGATFSSESDVKIGTLDAHLYNLTFAQDGINFDAKLYLLVDEENFYMVISVAKKDVWSKYETTLQTVVNSFKLL